MTTKTIIPGPHSRPFGILCNSTLPIKVDKIYYPSVSHYMMAMLLKTSEDRAVLLSHPGLFEATLVFNRLDEAQYLSIVRGACEEYLEKKFSSHAPDGKKTIGARFREALAKHTYFDYVIGDQENVPMKRIIGLDKAGMGYNILGQSLQKVKRRLKEVCKSTMVLDYLLHREEDVSSSSRRPPPSSSAPAPSEPKPLYVPGEIREEVEEEVVPVNVVDFMTVGKTGVAAEEEEDSEEEDEPLPRFYDEVFTAEIDPDTFLEEAAAFGEEEKKKREPVLYSVEYVPPSTRGLHWYETVNPIVAYKVSKIADYLVKEIQNGFDIVRYEGRSMDEIILRNGICPELFGLGKLPLSPSLRREIYVEFWDRFKAKTIPHYTIIENELRYPGNLVGFVRKQFLPDLNAHIGEKIRSILFQAFLRRVIETKYPEVPKTDVTNAFLRERAQFSADEYVSITDRLFHLFHAGRFDPSTGEEISLADQIRIMETHRKTVPQIEEASRFIPTMKEAHVEWREDRDLDPLSRITFRIQGRMFEDVFQYIYFRLFQVYGELSANEAFAQLSSSKDLQETLVMLIEVRRHKMLLTALEVKLDLYTQVKEMILFLKTTGSMPEFEDRGDVDTARAWRVLMADRLDPVQESVMRFVVSIVPESPTRFERCIFLYSFLSDFLRALKIFRNDIVAKKLDVRFLETFFRCFYHKLLLLPESAVPMPAGFDGLIRSFSVVVGVEEIALLWKRLAAYTHLFQQEAFVPSSLFAAARKEEVVSDVPKTAVAVLTRVLGCLFSQNPESEIRSEDMYAVVQILSGRTDIAPWSDPAFEMIEEVTHDGTDRWKNLPEDLRETNFFKKRMGKKKIEVMRHQIAVLHPEYRAMAPLLKKELNRPSLQDPVVSRATYALASLLKNLQHPQRLLFFV